MIDEAVTEKEMMRLYTQGYGVGTIAHILKLPSLTVRLTLKESFEKLRREKNARLGHIVFTPGAAYVFTDKKRKNSGCTGNKPSEVSRVLVHKESLPKFQMFTDKCGFRESFTLQQLSDFVITEVKHESLNSKKNKKSRSNAARSHAPASGVCG